METQPIFTRRGAVFSSWLGLAFAGAAAVVLLWFAQKVITALLMLFFAIVVAIALSAPVGWFMRRGLSRRWAGVVTLLLFVTTIVALAAWIAPTTRLALVQPITAFAERR